LQFNFNFLCLNIENEIATLIFELCFIIFLFYKYFIMFKKNVPVTEHSQNLLLDINFKCSFYYNLTVFKDCN